MHIGLIGGIGPAATDFYYRRLIEIFAAKKAKLELTMAHAEAAQLVSNISNQRPDLQAIVFAELARRLRAAGADALVISSLAGHFCLEQCQSRVPLPILSAITAIQEYLADAGIRRAGLLGNKASMETHLFGGVQGIEFATPRGANLQRVHDEYIKMATTGRISDDQREFLFQAGKDLCKEQGADAVLLAGTDLFLAFGGYDCGFPSVDCALVHVNSIARYAGVLC